VELLVSQSFGKNMSLYGERIGFLSGVVSDPGKVSPILSQLTLTVRPMVSVYT
jgi:aspartate/tyrosine/aromatic aminotransferase